MAKKKNQGPYAVNLEDLSEEAQEKFRQFQASQERAEQEVDFTAENRDQLPVRVGIERPEPKRSLRDRVVDGAATIAGKLASDLKQPTPKAPKKGEIQIMDDQQFSQLLQVFQQQSNNSQTALETVAKAVSSQGMAIETALETVAKAVSSQGMAIETQGKVLEAVLESNTAITELAQELGGGVKAFTTHANKNAEAFRDLLQELTKSEQKTWWDYTREGLSLAAAVATPIVGIITLVKRPKFRMDDATREQIREELRASMH